MKENFTPLHFKTDLVEFELVQVPGSDDYRAMVFSPIDFEIQFKFVNGAFVRTSDNPDFYRSLITGVEKAMVQKKHAPAQKKFIPEFMYFNEAAAQNFTGPLPTLIGLYRAAMTWFRPGRILQLFD